ncbi:uncharacterized protein LOC128609539 isoform X1 [Ictalurus furcatus]|uniref:uncharacterized protein LOC128609539 isoform X1 n=1 Tax=Ictalurus furcatus TaxID=66913 RepID=UPI002350EFD0|nr:uncharacterized protein LOC128609539 isoform X1 [Ictalurus furcatus]
MTSSLKTAKTDQCLPTPLVKATTCHCPQASSLQDAPSTASTKALPGKRMTLIEQLKVQKNNNSGNAQVEHIHKLRAPTPPTVPRRGRRLLPAQQESLESIAAHQPDINTSCGTRWVTEYVENFGLSQPVRVPPVKTANWKASIFYSTHNHHSADKCHHTEYQALYSPETDQCLPPPLVKATACHCPQASTPPPTASTKALPEKRMTLLEQLKVQKNNTSGSAQVEHVHKLRAPTPPTVPRRGRRLLPDQQESLERIAAHQPDINTPCGTRWVTEYVENFGLSQPVHLPCASKKSARRLVSTFRRIPNPHFADKYQRSEYQAIYGPEIRTAQFNLTRYRQLHGTA